MSDFMIEAVSPCQTDYSWQQIFGQSIAKVHKNNIICKHIY